MKREKFATFKGMPLIGVGLLAIALMMALLLNSFFNYNKRLVAQQQQQLINIVRSVSRSIDIYIENQKSSLAAFAATYGLTHDLPGEMAQYLAWDSAARATLLVVDETGKILLSSQNSSGLPLYSRECFQFPVSTVTAPTVVGTYLAQAHHYLLPIVTPIPLAPGETEQRYLAVFLDFEDLYSQIASTSIKADDKSYVIVKDDKGYILLHESRQQVGLHAVEGRKERYPGMDFSSMTDLINKEMKGQEGTFIFDSYWFSDTEPLEKAKKFSAFTPIQVDYGFWMVSINMDYENFIAPLNGYFFVILGVFSAILLIVATMISLLWRFQVKERALVKETAYLRELNSTLDELSKVKEKSRHAEKLQMVGIMTGGIAHDFNNILSPIMGYSELLLSELEEGSTPYGDAREIFESSCRAKDLVKQISSLSRKDVGKVVYESFNLCDKLNNWLKAAYLMKPENVTVHREIHTDDGWVYASQTQLYEIILNLCTNAFDAMEDGGGTLTVTLDGVPKEQLPPTLELSYLEERYLLFTVQDTGTGMDAETLDNIFTPFYTTKKPGEGTGLGLPLVQTILKNHNGAVVVQSDPGVGSTVTFCIPYQGQREEAAPHRAAGQPAPVSQGRILVVDDDPAIVAMLGRILRRQGYRVEGCVNPMDAVRRAGEGEAYDLLLSDYAMGVMNGLELAGHLKQQMPGIKVLIISGLVKKNILSAYKEGGIDGYMVKPVQTQELLQKLEELLGHTNTNPS